MLLGFVSDLRGDIRTHQENVHPLCEMPSAFRRTAATSATLPTQTEVRHFSCLALVDLGRGGGDFVFYWKLCAWQSYFSGL